MKRAIVILLIIAAVGAGAGAYYMRRNGTEVTVNTSPVTRGDIVDSVGATGTLQAVTTVQVGSQVSGNIQWQAPISIRSSAKTSRSPGSIRRCFRRRPSRRVRTSRARRRTSNDSA